MSLHQINKNIQEACQAAGREHGAVTLLAVSKNQLPPAILPILKAGHRLFGENRVQEAADKWPSLRAQYPDCHIHLIGPLQTNKVRQALSLFDAIESVDRPSLVLALAKEWGDPNQRTHKILIQVNTGHELQKSGVLVDDLAALVELCLSHGLPLTGLMCIPPAHEDPAPHFQQLAALAKTHQLPDLSMGMSGDYQVAIATGATWVRIGSALWGSQQPARLDF